MPESIPLDWEYWAEQLATPIQFRQCIESIFNDSNDQETAFLDLGMGLRLTRLVQNSLQDTQEWRDGGVKAISLIASPSVKADEKSEDGWRNSLEPLTSEMWGGFFELEKDECAKIDDDAAAAAPAPAVIAGFAEPSKMNDLLLSR